MKLSKRILAAFLSVCMIASSGSMQAEANDKMWSDSGQIESRTEEKLLANKMEERLPESRTEERLPENGTEQKPEKATEQNQPEGWETGVLNFIMQESEQIQVPGVQNVVAGLGVEGDVIKQAQLQYKNTATGQEFTADAAGIADNMVRFSMEYTQEGQAGIYRLDRVSWKQGGKQYQADLAELGMDL